MITGAEETKVVTDTTATFDGLSPGRFYSVTVTARKDGKAGVTSEPVIVRTKDEPVGEVTPGPVAASEVPVPRIAVPVVQAADQIVGGVAKVVEQIIKPTKRT